MAFGCERVKRVVTICECDMQTISNPNFFDLKTGMNKINEQ